ncbi:MAG: hypothetical protein ACRD3L_09740 [Terriglobales bacterium]
MPAPHSTTAYDPFFSDGRPVWERDYLVYVDPYSPRVDLYDKDKSRASIKVAISGYSDLELVDATVTQDGRAIVTGCADADEDGTIHCFIGLASREGRVSPVVDTERFVPDVISTCDGEAVWAMGWQRAASDPYREDDKPYNVLRQYRLGDGKIVASELPRSSFRYAPTDRPPTLTMQCRGKLLGIYEGRSEQWIEYDGTNGHLTRWKLPKVTHDFARYDSSGNQMRTPIHVTHITGVAMLDSGGVYASFVHVARDGSAKATMGLFRMEKSGDHGNWVPIAQAQGIGGEQGTFGDLWGTDGRELVYSRIGEHHWFFSSPPR